MPPFKPDSSFPGVHGGGSTSRDDDIPQEIVPRVSTPTRRAFGGNGRQTVKLDFASKGLTQVELKQMGQDEGPEARLQGTAMYIPAPGWPLYTADRNMQENGEGLQFPVKVNFRVALTNFPEAMTTLRRNTKIYLDLLDNGYDWHERFIGMWKSAEEGTWAISIHQEAVTLPEYWAAKIRPGVERMEAKWKANHGKRRKLDDPNICRPTLKSSTSFNHYASFSDRWQDRTPGDNDSTGSPALAVDTNASSTVQRFDVSDLRQELKDVASSLGDVDSSNFVTSPLSETKDRVTPEEETALAGGTSEQGETPIAKTSQGEESGEPTKHVPPRHVRRKTSLEQEEADRAELEREWVHAVEILIQLADCLLAFHERRLALVVCRPEYFSVYSKPFKPKSSVESNEQSVSLDLVRTSSIVPLSGYQDGKVIQGLNGDFDGDRVIASGPGAGVFAAADSLTDETSERSNLTAGGALEGTFDEKAIRRHLRYIAPEAISDKKAIGSVVDIFSWGVAAYELITGQWIEEAEYNGTQDLLRDIHIHSIRSVKPIVGLLSSIPPELCEVIKKTVSLDPDDRYSNMCSVLHDLHKVKEICEGKLSGSARREYQPGYIDVMSRFKVPPGLLDRSAEEDEIDQAYQKVKMTGKVETLCTWGLSGSGKSKLLQIWARRKEASNAGQECLVGWAKMDQHLVKPLSAFVAIFSSLLDRIFSDPLENPELWRKRIANALSVNGNVFLSLIPPVYRKLLLDQEIDTVETSVPLGLDWDRYVKQFRSWSYGLLRLFATKSRPLIIVLDDYQWVGAEKGLWEDLILHPMRHLDNTLVLLTFRTLDRTPPDMSPLENVRLIEARPFSKDVLQTLVLKCFHFDHSPGSIRERVTPQWTILIDFLYEATKGNPFYIKMIMTALIRDRVAYFDFRLLKWIVKVEQLDRYASTGMVEFVTNTLNSLSEEACEVLRVLACLPSRGVDINLLVDVLQKPATTVRTLIDEAATLGSVHVTQTQKVEFIHDKHHQAALNLITPDDRSKLCVTLANKLENRGDDYIFSRADLIIEATDLDPDCYPIRKKAEIITSAARRAVRVAALGLAEKYLQHTLTYANITSEQFWDENPQLALELTIIQAEVAMAVRKSAEILSEIRQARTLAKELANRISISSLLFRLSVSASDTETARQTFRDVFKEIGITIGDRPAAIPRTAEEVDVLIDDIKREPKQKSTSAEDEMVVAVAKLCLTAGATLYSHSTDHSKDYFDHAAQLIVSNPAARRHTAAAYTYTMHALLAAGGLNVELARSWLRLANFTKGSGETPYYSSIEAFVVTLDFLNCGSITEMDYGAAYEACLANNNMDTLTYATGLDLAGSFLAGRDLQYTLDTGKKVLRWLQYDMSPASKVMIASSIQLAANFSDTERDIKELSVLAGDYLTPDDTGHLDNLPPLFAIVYWTNALACGLVYLAPESKLRPLVAQVYKYLDGGSGTLMMFYSRFCLSWFSIIFDAKIDTTIVASTKKKLLAFRHNRDFVNMVKCLDALQDLRRMQEKDISWEAAVDSLEAAIEALDIANQHLLRGRMALTGAIYLSWQAPNRKRVIQGYVLHARSAYAQCNGSALVRYTDELFQEATAHFLTMISGPMSHSYTTAARTEEIMAQPSCTNGADMTEESVAVGHALTNTVGKDGSKESNLERKLSLESVLRSFLVLASERSSDALIQKVLRILMEISRAEWSCLALQDPTTNSLHLRGAGSYDSLEIHNRPISEASEICPALLLLSGSISHKNINTALPLSASIKNLIEREPFFQRAPPKHVLMTPLFVQGRYFGSLVLTGRNPTSSNATSQISLLATFAAIALEAHSAYASMEQAVEARTAALEQALAYRQTFISSISHELRTPLYSISGLCAVMQNSTDLTAAQNENLGVIASSAEDLQRIVTAILDMAKLESGGMTAESIPFDLRDALESSLESVAHISRAKNIELVLENDVSTDPPGRILGDPHRLRQCLLNLLSNAVKFGRAGDRAAHIKVGWTIESTEEEGTDMITISVTDNGIGIQKSKMNRLFHSFSQIDASITRQYGGSGLGLSITRGLARVLGGDCWAESAEGQGSTFYLMFKVKREPTSNGDAGGEGKGFPPGPERRAALLTPTNETGQVLVRNLELFNIRTRRVDAAEDVGEAHFVVVDVDDVAGMRERVEELKKWGKEYKIIYLVALTEVSLAMETLSLTHESIVTKPIKARALYEATQQLAETKRSVVKRTGGSTTMDKGYGKRYPLKILYVDDNSINTVVGRKLLSRFGYNDIDICYDGSQAMTFSKTTAYDLILLDLQMPVDGYTALAHIRASSKTKGSPRVVALTANADENTRSRCERAGFDGFLSKPLVIATLAETLRGTWEVKQGAAGREE